MNLMIVVGARPNFIKIAPLIRAIDSHNIMNPTRKMEYRLVHTGQHYDYKMSQVFFEDLRLPSPDIHLEIGSGSHAEQTGMAMIAIEKLLLKEKPDLLVVVGDVNSTLAAGLAAVKVHIPIAHIEAGLRLCDFSFPEEVNRILVDVISTYLFTPCIYADENLIKEGISEKRIFFVGNILADSIYSQLELANKRTILFDLGLGKRQYAVLTMHRPSNVDNIETLLPIIKTIKNISQKLPIIYPAHPRTQKNIKELGLEKEFSWVSSKKNISNNKAGFYLIEPQSYLNFLQLEANAKFIITDSGGVQAETTILNVPCLTLMTEDIWPSTVTEGTNTLVGINSDLILTEAYKILNGNQKKGTQLPLWDGKTAERIVSILDAHFKAN